MATLHVLQHTEFHRSGKIHCVLNYSTARYSLHKCSETKLW